MIFITNPFHARVYVNEMSFQKPPKHGGQVVRGTNFLIKVGTNFKPHSPYPRRGKGLEVALTTSGQDLIIHAYIMK